MVFYIAHCTNVSACLLHSHLRNPPSLGTVLILYRILRHLYQYSCDIDSIPVCFCRIWSPRICYLFLKVWARVLGMECHTSDVELGMVWMLTSLWWNYHKQEISCSQYYNLHSLMLLFYTSYPKITTFSRFCIDITQTNMPFSLDRFLSMVFILYTVSKKLNYYTPNLLLLCDRSGLWEGVCKNVCFKNLCFQ